MSGDVRLARLDEWSALDAAKREALRGTSSETYAAGDVAQALLACVLDVIPEDRWRLAVQMEKESIARGVERRAARA